MREVEYLSKLYPNVSIRYKMDINRGKVIYFVIQLFYYENDKIYEISRYDSAHNVPHKHLLYKKPEEKILYEYYSNEQVITIAEEDFTNNYENYIKEYKKRYIKA